MRMPCSLRIQYGVDFVQKVVFRIRQRIMGNWFKIIDIRAHVLDDAAENGGKNENFKLEIREER